MSHSPPPKPFNEEYRLTVLQDLSILYSDAEPAFDRLVWLARKHFGTKFALVSLVGADRQWFKASCGLDAKQMDRKYAFCAHAIMEREASVVLDATRDNRFAENPLVVGPPHIRFYAGAPIVVRGAAIGTLCVVDDKPRESFGLDDKETLQAYARIVEDEIRLRERTRESAENLLEKFRDAQRLAEAGETAKAQFLALMSHELRTPLNAVIGFADCISSELIGPIEPPAYKEFAEQIVTSGRRQLSLIDRLLELTEMGFVDIDEEAIDLCALIRRCVKSLSGEMLIAGVNIDIQLPNEVVTLKGDPIHVEQILLELIGNAIKFTPQQGRICVELGLDTNNCVMVAITDTGIGIDENALDEALAVFGQISAGLNRKYEGAGIGLPIVKKLAELHGAELSLSAPHDGGTRAQVRFPHYRTVVKRNQLDMTG